MRDVATMSFHLLRPLWLLALIPLAVVFAVLLRRQDVRAQWGGVIAPHLLTHLIVRPGQGRHVNPVYLVAAGMMLGIIGLSGPTWRRELPPFVEDKAPLMIALAVGSSMNETDVAPSRLERAKQKIRDLLAARAGARTGLVAFAGTAHLVMPPTDDRSVIEPFLAALEPGLMPADGKNVASAVALAADALAAEPVPGTVLLVADDLGTADAATIRQAAGRNGLVIFAVSPATSVLPAGADVIRVSIDGSDIVRLERRIETRFQAAQGDAFGTQWRDEGYWLLPPLALLSLLWFRRGTTVAWVLALFIVTHASASRAEETSRFTNLWLTPDQQGRLAFDRGDYAAAKTIFADPMWRGISAYRAYDFLAAAEEFSRVDTLEGKFALGNAQAQNHAYEKALKTYDEVLKAQPGNAAAKTNRAIVQAALEVREAKRRKQEQDDPAPPDEKADEMRVDPNQKGGKKITVTPQDVTTAGAAEAWMRQVQTSPADFLKLKFAIQAAAPTQGRAPQ
ncbi:Ca-activated chloride channel family protein [Bradyrhizobium japonicum USDA 38]|nr:VWA domain-containing protein [Bradyrhizobium japonicum]MCS3896392.1 Ca-activated chloride channel family protein [Bradyrhizobium japonicum USDA 38]MCS3948906.1 Ca-activated chloride channel family protein [Bradyrhizobium japonicum]MCW2218394.1 Ca-activated chloride channel family protein [Bradyrhizobium japonicum]MCW2343008.1 Ca-activated chloride channel family protein [Bradyrhizobium japonicum]